MKKLLYYYFNTIHLKKRKYNATNEKGFNAGVIICLGCSEEDNKQIDVEIEKAMKATLEDPENATTEERILSDVFKNRYLPLEPKSECVCVYTLAID